MTQRKKESLDLDEKIQSLAGDIYVEIEEKVSSFVASYIKNKEINEHDVEQHEHYQLLRSSHEKLQATFDSCQASNVEQNIKLQNKIESLDKKLKEGDEKLNNFEQLNSAKLTDSEQVLKEKLSELSSQSAQLTKATKSEEKLKGCLAEEENKRILLSKEVASLEKAEKNLTKNDKAKSATLAVQNQQISALTLELNNTVSELDFIKAEQNQKLALTSQQQTQEREELVGYQQASEHLKVEVAKLNKELLNQKALVEAKSIEVENYKEHYEKLKSEHQDGVEQWKLTIAENQEKLINTVKSTEQLQEKNTAFEKTIKDKNTELDKLALTLLDKNETVNALQEKLTVDKKQLEERLAQSQEKNTAFENTIKNNNTELDKLALTLLDKNETVNALQEKITVDNKQHEERLAQSQEKNTAFENTIKNNNTELDKLALILVDKNETVNALQEKLTVDNKQHEESLALSNNDVQALEKELSEKAEFIKESQLNYQHDTDELQQKIITYQSQASKNDKKNTFSAKQLTLLQQKNYEISEDFIKAKTRIVNLEKEACLLKEEAESAQQNINTIKQRVEVNREKQELEYDKARETIKILRDENADLNTKLDLQVSELEDKLREYRLRFEYAQKQLSKG